jgi:4-oxalocrotonate tautomerase
MSEEFQRTLRIPMVGQVRTLWTPQTRSVAVRGYTKNWILMPIVQISLVEGRKPDDIKRCVRAVAAAVHDNLGAPLTTIRVTVNQIPAFCWGVGDRTKDEMDVERDRTFTPRVDPVEWM